MTTMPLQQLDSWERRWRTFDTANAIVTDPVAALLDDQVSRFCCSNCCCVE